MAARRVRWWIVVGGAVALAACGSGSEVHRAVPEPSGSKVVATVDDGPRAWTLLEDGDCVLLRIGAHGRRSLSEPACPYGALVSTFRVSGPDAVFNDRDVRVQTCNGDCAGPRPDVTMSTPVVWGRADPNIGFICLHDATGPVIVRPSRGGYVLASVPLSVDQGPDGVLPFLPDGRFAGSEGPGQEGMIDACRTAGAPGSTPLASRGWPLRIELADELRDSGIGLFVSTDTGYFPEGASLSVLAQGARIPLRLHPDTTALVVTHETDQGGAVSKRLPLPARITDALTGAQPCGWPPTIIIRLDREITPHLRLGDDGKACP